MSRARLLLFCSLIMLSGCTWPVRQQTDRIVRELASQPFDPAPLQQAAESKPKRDETPSSAKTSAVEANVNEIEPVPDIQTTALMQTRRDSDKLSTTTPKYDLKIPSGIPGSEALPIDFKNMTAEQKQQAIRRLYPELPPLPAAPTPQPGPNDRPYTLADLQKIGRREQSDAASGRRRR